jgi:hypothetical protein
VCVSPETAFTNRAVLVLMPGPSEEFSRLGLDHSFACVKKGKKTRVRGW